MAKPRPALFDRARIAVHIVHMKDATGDPPQADRGRDGAGRDLALLLFPARDQRDSGCRSDAGWFNMSQVARSERGGVQADPFRHDSVRTTA